MVAPSRLFVRHGSRSSRLVVRHGSRLLWADALARINFDAFGDCLAFDATYRTNKSESENSFFGCFLHPGMNLTEFFLTFESAMESQRQKKDRLDHESQSTYPLLKTSLAIEKHAEKDEVEFYTIKDKSMTHNVFEVVHYTTTDFAECNCKNFQRIGILCRHILLALNAEDVNEIPKCFVMRRWTKYAAHKPAALSYNDLAGTDSADTVKVKLNMLYMQFNLTMKTHGSNIEYISELLDMLQEFNKRHDAQTTQLSKHAMFERLIGCSKPSSIEVQTPKQSRNKGCGKRMKSTKEKMTEQASKPLRKCNFSKQMVSHDIRNCLEQKHA
uniref:SWIM-type domain-containing protein n=1 Tax=Kalanchoe fedtschenkoi TaxID=63787 RepID=A0A7N0TDI2_KALFE